MGAAGAPAEAPPGAMASAVMICLGDGTRIAGDLWGLGDWGLMIFLRTDWMRIQWNE